MFDVLRVPGSARLFIASMVGRAPASALGLVFVLRTRDLTGSFAAAGLASGAQALAWAAVAPVLGRLVDRRGQPAVLVASALGCAAALLAFAALPHGSGLVAILPCAVLAGAAMPPLGPCLRTVWPSLLGERAHAAFAFESAVLEIAYIAGPVLIAGAIGAWSTAASAVAAAVLLLGGTLVFASAPASRAWRPSAAAGGSHGALRSAGVRTLLLAFVLIGATFGAVEVAVPAASAQAGHPGAAGLLLGVWGLGSLLGGLAAARQGAPRDRVRRLCVLLGALGAGHMLLTAPVGLLALAALLVLAGAAIAPAFGLAYGLVDGVAREGTVTEAFTWLTTGLAGGLAAGSGLGGALAQHAGAGAVFALAATSTAAAAAFVAARRSTLGAAAQRA